MQDYCVAHVIADLGARHCLFVCPMQGRQCHGVGGRGAVVPPCSGLLSQGVGRSQGALIQKTICVMSK